MTPVQHDDVRCPACGSIEWFPGATCWDCGWPDAIPEDGPQSVESGDGGTKSSPSYRSAMNDAGRGHLLP